MCARVCDAATRHHPHPRPRPRPLCSYFNMIDRIAAPGYTATVEDLLKSRVRTSGIVEEAYRIDGVDFV